MTLPIPKGYAVIILVALLLVFGGIALFFKVSHEDHRGWDAKDSVHVISMEVAQLLQRSPPPTQAEIDESIRRLITGSVINAELDSQNRPSDSYGTPFRVRHTVEGALHRVTATSAGPDRQFDTPEDISRDATWEPLAPEKR
jgi:hypothetical protein